MHDEITRNLHVTVEIPEREQKDEPVLVHQYVQGVNGLYCVGCGELVIFLPYRRDVRVRFKFINDKLENNEFACEGDVL